jgi:lipopolysaccharide/colanic/teichoic acid biosynthesis glycosyltransferase
VGIVTLNDERTLSEQSRGTFVADAAPVLTAGRRAKRGFDLAVAAIALILLSPLILIVFVALKLDSRGAVFSWQVFYGYGSRPIQVLKIRSAGPHTEASGLSSSATSLGRVLRRCGIDELPQLFNVLRGDLSIVGPRLHICRQDLADWHLTPLLNVKPGMIDPAQVGETRAGLRTNEQRVEDDLGYVENWSLFLDIKIILKAVFSMRMQEPFDEGEDGKLAVYR